MRRVFISLSIAFWLRRAQRVDVQAFEQLHAGITIEEGSGLPALLRFAAKTFPAALERRVICDMMISLGFTPVCREARHINSAQLLSRIKLHSTDLARNWLAHRTTLRRGSVWIVDRREWVGEAWGVSA